MNEEINIAPYLESENFIETIFYFSDSTLLRTGFLLDGTIRTRDLEDEFELEEEFLTRLVPFWMTPCYATVLNGDVAIPPVTLKNLQFFVAGFGASIPDLILEQYQYLLHNDLTEYYHHFNLTHLLDELLATGHDVVVVRFIEPLESIIDGAARLEHLIHLINERKYANGSYIENVITGYSAGAIMVRYALTEMEYLHYGSGHQHPHTKLYVSFEGEQDGANVALGSQHALQHMTDNHTDIVNLFLSYIQNSDQSRELSRYFYDQTGKLQIVGGVEVSSSQGQGPHDDRLDLMYDFNYDQITPKQIEKMGYYGYPAFSRNVCVTNGSRHTEYFNGNLVQNSPYLFSPGQTIFMKETSNKKWQVNWASNLSVYGFSGPSTIFLYREENIWGNTVLEENYRTDNNMLILDNAPGGFIQGVDPVALVFKDMKVELEGLFGDPDIYNYFSNCFTPLVFTLDIRNFTHSAFDFQLHYDLQEQELMHDDFDFDNTPQSDFYGYPVLGHPVNHFSITPFEAIYADEFNQSHISSYNIELGGASVNDLYETGHPHIKNFIIGEIQYYWVFLQNQQVGWNTEPGGTYKAEYEAESTIVIGEFVTPRTDIAPYVVLENATVICHAGEEINLRQGFHAVAGSDFHAFIEAPCIYTF
ncbi:MAG: hypothetical protein IPG07_17245 [Crocinitomicaceae bacterium]|nr:hypothetical protein [Crocinitomicaceae bacterium]